MEGKIIGVGFQKTGTSSLREALKVMDYKVKDCCPRALIPILKGNYNENPIWDPKMIFSKMKIVIFKMINPHFKMKSE